jgi:hypothetical protein
MTAGQNGCELEKASASGLPSTPNGVLLKSVWSSILERSAERIGDELKKVRDALMSRSAG